MLAAPVGIAPRGFACLGALTDAYRPDMDFGQLCQMLVDMAGYRQYETREVQEDDGEGYLNRDGRALGQQRGRPAADRRPGRPARGADVGLRRPGRRERQRLDIKPLDEHWEDYEDEG